MLIIFYIIVSKTNIFVIARNILQTYYAYIKTTIYKKSLHKKTILKNIICYVSF